MDGIAASYLKKFYEDPMVRCTHPQAAKLFAIKVSNLIKKGHKVEAIDFYWTHGSQSKPDRGPYLRASMLIDGKLNRFWFYCFESSFGGKYSWQNTTKQRESRRIGGDQR